MNSTEPKANLDLSAAPRVFDFVDFREFLRAFYKYKKATSREFSLGTFAIKAHLNTRNYLKRVMDGERPLTPENLPKFCMAIGLQGKEALYFESLVNYNQAKDALIKKYYFEQLRASADGSKSSIFEITQAHYEIFKEWYILPIFELLNLSHIDQDAKAIAKKMRNKVTPQEVKNALHLLEKVELIELNAETKRYVTKPKALAYSKDVVNMAVRDFHKQMLELTKKAIDEDTLDKRYLRSLSIAVTPSQVAEVKKEVDELFKKINQKYSKESKEDGELLQINCQVLDLT